MKRLCYLLAAAVTVITFASAALALEVPLKYERFPDNPGSFMPSGAAPMEIGTAKPPGRWKLPELKSKNPLYAVVKLGDSERLLVLDAKSGDDPFYTRLYFDGNGNDRFDDRFYIPGGFIQSSMAVRQRVYAVGDQLFLSDGDGAIDPSASQILGDYLMVNGALYGFAVSMTKGTLTLTEITAGLSSRMARLSRPVPSSMGEASPVRPHGLAPKRTPTTLFCANTRLVRSKRS